MNRYKLWIGTNMYNEWTSSLVSQKKEKTNLPSEQKRVKLRKKRKRKSHK